MTAVVIDISDMSWDPDDDPADVGHDERGAYDIALGVKPGLSTAW